MNKKIVVHSPVDPIVIGKIGRAYGVLGWMKIISFTEQSSNIFDYIPWFIILKSKYKLIRLQSWRLIGKNYIAKVDGVLNRECAMLLTQHELIIDSSQLPRLEGNEYYWKDILGCFVVDSKNIWTGYVINILGATLYDIMVVQINENTVVKVESIFIPFILKKIVNSVNLITRTIVVNWDYDC